MVTFALIAGLTRHRKASLGRRGNRAGSKFLGFGGLCLRIIINMSLLPARIMIICLGLLKALHRTRSRDTHLIPGATRDNALHINLSVTLSSPLGIFDRLLLFTWTEGVFERGWALVLGLWYGQNGIPKILPCVKTGATSSPCSTMCACAKLKGRTGHATPYAR
jgi:hypothetical protein